MRDFPHPSRPALGPTQSSTQWEPGLSPGVKRPGRGVDHLPPSSAEVKEKVELYFYSPLGLRGLFQGELYLYFYHLNIILLSMPGSFKWSLSLRFPHQNTLPHACYMPRPSHFFPFDRSNNIW